MDNDKRDEGPGPLPPVPVHVGVPPQGPLPARTPENFLCMRNCRHYWHMVVPVDCSNPAGTWDAMGIPEPRQHVHTCTAQPGCETALDGLVYECSRFDPLTPRERRRVRRRREKYGAVPEPAPDDGGDE